MFSEGEDLPLLLAALILKCLCFTWVKYEACDQHNHGFSEVYKSLSLNSTFVSCWLLSIASY